MDNTNDNAQLGGSSELDAMKAMYADWKKSSEKNNKPKKPTREDVMKRYFVPREETEKFRPIHPNINEQYVKFAYFHEVFLNKAGGKKQKRKIYCPAHNDPQVQATDNAGNPVFDEQGKPVMVNKKCPICEASKAILAKQDNVNGKAIAQKKKNNQPLTEEEVAIKKKNDEIYTASKKIEAKKFYMVKGIDRFKEKDGPKFWRFKHNWKQQGTGDKLVPTLFRWSEASGHHFANPENGIDLDISMVENTIPGSNYTYMDVSAINTDPRGSSPLHHDPMIAKAWLEDKTTWRDVFKPLEYRFMDSDTLLDRIAKGTDPYWDDSNPNDKKWVFPDVRDAELAIKANTRTTNLDATESNFERASDMPTNEVAAYNVVNQASQPSMYDLQKEDVSADSEDAVNLTPQPKREIADETISHTPPPETTTQAPAQNAEQSSVSDVIGDSDIDELDLPF